MALVDAFNRRSGLGYIQARRAIASRDVMFGFSTNNPENSGFFPGEDRPASPIQAVIGGYEEQKHSLMSKLYGNKSYKVDSVHTDNMKRDVGSAVKDSVKVAGQHANAVQDVRDKKAAFVQDWKEAKGQAVGMLRDVAKDMGHNMADAERDLVGKGSSSPIGTTAALGADMMLGGGTLATMAGGAVVVQELGEERKRLAPKEQKALLDETLRRLQAGKRIDTREVSGSGRGGASSLVVSDKSGADRVNWEELSAKEFKEFLAADPEGEDQPEMKSLRDVEHHLQGISRNHQYVQEHYGDVVTADKLEAAGVAPQEPPAVEMRPVSTAVALLAAGSLWLIATRPVEVDKEAVDNLPLKPEDDVPTDLKAVLGNEMSLRFRV